MAVRLDFYHNSADYMKYGWDRLHSFCTVTTEMPVPQKGEKVDLSAFNCTGGWDQYVVTDVKYVYKKDNEHIQLTVRVV